MAQVFISYSRKNLSFVEYLAKDLKAAGLDVWYDISDLVGGVQWLSKIQNAISQSQYFIVVLSPDSIQSEWVEREFLFAEKLKLKIVPLLLQPCDLPMWSMNLHLIDVQGKNYEIRFEDIRRALNIEQQIETYNKLDCVVLCGGYAARLWPLTYDISKVLLPVAGKPVLKYVTDFVQESSVIKKSILSVNRKFEGQIQNFLDLYQSQKQLSHPIEIMVEPSSEQKEKLGPVGALQYIISQSTPRDLLVLGGDNIFGFQLDDFLGVIPKTGETCSYNAVYEYQDQTQNDSEYGTVELDQAGNFLTFIEKPKRLSYKNISTACYYFKKRDVEAIYDYIQAGKDPDSLGNFVHWLIKQSRIKSYVFSTFWFDVGTREVLIQANNQFLTHSIAKIAEIPENEYVEPTFIDTNSKISISKLGPNVYIGPDVQVINSTIRDSIVMEQCIITGSDINNSVIGSGSIIEGQIIEAVCGPKSRFAK